MELNKIYNEECLEGMNERIPDNSIDMILADLPYGTTACKWDSIIPLEPLWEQYKRIVKDDSAIVLTASGKFTPRLKMSNFDWFKYEWIWEKAVGGNFASVKYQPMKEHEHILIFGKGKTKYNPQFQERKGSCRGKIPDYTNVNSRSKDKKGKVYGGINRNRDGKKYSKKKKPE